MLDKRLSVTGTTRRYASELPCVPSPVRSRSHTPPSWRGLHSWVASVSSTLQTSITPAESYVTAGPRSALLKLTRWVLEPAPTVVWFAAVCQPSVLDVAGVTVRSNRFALGK